MSPERGSTPEIGMMRVEQAVMVEASPRRVFEALTGDVSAWWGPPHIIDEKRSRDIVMEPRLGGRLYEDWGDGAGALWATVTRIRPDEYLELTGPLGTRRVVMGVITFTLEPRGGGTLLRLSHRALGEMGPDTETSYDEGWRDLLERKLKAYAERGERLGLRRG